jgi:hypothetical protein
MKNLKLNNRKKNRYLATSLQCLFAFFIATFSVAFFFSHLTPGWATAGAILILLYVFVLFACTRLVCKHFSVAALMLLTPIVPLLALLFVLMLLPLLTKI